MSYLLLPLELANVFVWNTWPKGYRAQVPRRDYVLQLLLSTIAIAAAAFLVVEGMLQVVGVPLIEADTLANPSAEKIAELFAKRDAGDLATVSCTCTNTVTSLSSVSNWTAPEDSFCKSLREIQQLPSGSDTVNTALIDLFSRLLDPTNEACIGTPGPIGADPGWDAFLSSVTAVATTGALFAGAPPEELAEDIFLMAVDMQRALCGAAFGSVSTDFPVVLFSALDNVCATPTFPTNTEVPRMVRACAVIFYRAVLLSPLPLAGSPSFCAEPHADALHTISTNSRSTVLHGIVHSVHDAVFSAK